VLGLELELELGLELELPLGLLMPELELLAAPVLSLAPELDLLLVELDLSLAEPDLSLPVFACFFVSFLLFDLCVDEVPLESCCIC